MYLEVFSLLLLQLLDRTLAPLHVQQEASKQTSNDWQHSSSVGIRATKDELTCMLSACMKQGIRVAEEGSTKKAG
jgi:hypothetical protein